MKIYTLLLSLTGIFSIEAVHLFKIDPCGNGGVNNSVCQISYATPVGNWTDLNVTSEGINETADLNGGQTYIIVKSGQADTILTVTSDSGTATIDDNVIYDNVPDGWYGVGDAIWVTTNNPETISIEVKSKNPSDDTSVFIAPVNQSGDYPEDWNWSSLSNGGQLLAETSDSIQIGTWKGFDLEYDEIEDEGVTQIETIELLSGTTYFFATSGEIDTNLKITNDKGESQQNDDDLWWDYTPSFWYADSEELWYTTGATNETITIDLRPYEAGHTSLYIYPVSNSSSYPDNWNWGTLNSDKPLMYPEPTGYGAKKITEWRLVSWRNLNNVNSYGVSHRDVSQKYNYQELSLNNYSQVRSLFNQKFYGFQTYTVSDFAAQCETEGANALENGDFKDYQAGNAAPNVQPDLDNIAAYGEDQWEKYIEVICNDNSGAKVHFYIIAMTGENLAGE